MTMDFFCAAIFSLPIVGAYETSPGWMTIHQLDPETQIVGKLGVSTNDYLACLEGDYTSTNSAGD